MKYIKNFEGTKQPFKKPRLGEEFSRLKNVQHRSFNLEKISDECYKNNYDIDIYALFKEMLLNRKLAFQSFFYVNFDENDKAEYDSMSHYILDICEDIKFHGGWGENDFDVVIKTPDNKWHTIQSGRRVRIYNYKEGPIMEEFEAKKDAKKYNL